MMLFIFMTLLIFDNSASIPLEQFYPFGSGAGDSRVLPNDDSSSPNITISSLFPFFNQQHSKLIVNTNGAISFLGTLSQFTPDPFPLTDHRQIITPFWADVDTREGGIVWFRETTNASLLENATQEIRQYIPSQPRFHASWVFIATWDNVAFFGCNDTGCSKRNTFQAVLVTNGLHSFTIFNYKKVQWTTGTASKGNPYTGLGGVPAQIGFDAGDGINFYAVNGSRTPDILNIASESNVGVPGKFVFRIDTAKVEQGGCNSNGFLTIVPNKLSMMGGEKLYIGGPCMNYGDRIKISFDDGVELPCQRENDYSFTCITPMFYTTNDVIVRVHITPSTGRTTTYIGTVTPINLAKTKPTIWRQNPFYWKNSERLTIQWSNNGAQLMKMNDEDHVDIDIFGLNIANGTLRWKHSKTVATNVSVGTGSASFTLGINEFVAAVRLSPSSQVKLMWREGVWSDVFYVIKAKQDLLRMCSEWRADDDLLFNLDDVTVQPCPCTLQQALIDYGRFQRDPTCNKFSDVGEGENINCLYNRGAKHCVRLSSPGKDGTGIRCCYDESSQLIDLKSTPGGGTVHRYHYLGNSGSNIPYLFNFYYDISPFLHCCTFSGRILNFEGNGQNGKYFVEDKQQCVEFLQRRPPSKCEGYNPPTPASAHGDPHMLTLDGLKYTFNGIGEYTLLRDVNGTFKIDVRMEQVTDDQGIKKHASVFTSVVAHFLNNSDVVEVTLNTIRIADVLINGHIVEFTDTQWLDFKGVSVLLSYANESGIITKDILLTFDQASVGIRVIATKYLMNIITVVGSDQLKDNVEGLLGNFDGDKTNDLKPRGGEFIPSNSTAQEIFRRFGETWRIESKDSIFTYPIGKNYTSYRNTRFVPQFNPPVTVTNETKRICGNDTDCIFDFHTSGIKEIAETTVKMTKRITEIKQASDPVASCGNPPSVSNGLWDKTGLTEGSSASLVCADGYKLENSHRVYCDKNGQWITNETIRTDMSCKKDAYTTEAEVTFTSNVLEQTETDPNTNTTVVETYLTRRKAEPTESSPTEMFSTSSPTTVTLGSKMTPKSGSEWKAAIGATGGVIGVIVLGVLLYIYTSARNKRRIENIQLNSMNKLSYVR